MKFPQRSEEGQHAVCAHTGQVFGSQVGLGILGREKREDVERDVPIPVLGPDLIDLRLLEVTAEKTAQGLVEAREETLDKPTLIPSPQPETPEEEAPAADASAAPKGPSKLDLLRAKSAGIVDPDESAEAPKPAAKPAAKHTKKQKKAEARPSIV